MHGHFPPFTRKDTAEPVEPVEPVAAVSNTEAQLRTLKHYLYHAGLLVDDLLAAECHIPPPNCDGFGSHHPMQAEALRQADELIRN
ncbi:hypothetical protein ISN76_13025 [Dyella halodurans]|uniref:Uncharacterized protein n=1 Tax=Dyella halodurans TaxID=1920171 RepID=A0ABV9C0K2_9GAMM|nr:hypothetical protein [Dyella halodurans]